MSLADAAFKKAHKYLHTAEVCVSGVMFRSTPDMESHIRDDLTKRLARVIVDRENFEYRTAKGTNVLDTGVLFARLTVFSFNVIEMREFLKSVSQDVEFQLMQKDIELGRKACEYMGKSESLCAKHKAEIAAKDAEIKILRAELEKRGSENPASK